ncbi:MAG: sugar transferase [Pseudomonas sp.]|nr:sugar transferase [Pseudomonas sp.]
MKRLLDFFASFFGFLLVSPLLLLIALVIKIDSPGAIFFVQERVGRKGVMFKILKFRTMLSRASNEIDQRKEMAVNTGNDPRVTRVGRFLRATSLDELPQLLNILKGDMSIVGPRPIIPEQKPFIPPSYLRRFDAAPGLTGLAQVRGRRSLGWLEQLAYDREYVEQQTFWFDLKIIFETAWMVIARKGIYGSPGVNWRTYANQLEGREPRDQDVLDAIKLKKGSF